MPACSDNAIMVLQLARIGDFLQTTPLLAALKADSATALQVLVPPACAPLAWSSKLVDEVYVFNPRDLQEALEQELNWPLKAARLNGLLGGLKDIKPQTAYNLNFSKLAALAMHFMRPGQSRGWQFAQGKLVGESWMAFVMAMAGRRRLSRMHLSDILASYANPAQPPLERLACHASAPDLEQAEQLLAGCGKGPLVGLQLGANHRLRRWPTESFAALARGLQGKGAQIVLLGSQAEQPLAAKFMRNMDGAPILNLMGRTSLTELAAVLSRLDLLVSSDTGTLHMGSAVGTTCLALYMGPAQVHETGPYGVKHLTLQARQHCAPCAEANPQCQGLAPCRYFITPEMAARVCSGLLQGQTPAEAAAVLGRQEAVTALQAKWDNFGLRYQPLLDPPLTLEDALALSLREMGRVILRSRYAGSMEELKGEFAAYRPPAPEVKAELVVLLKFVRQLAQGGNPPLPATLQHLHGLYAHGPSRLQPGWLAAGQVLELAVSL